MKKLVIAALIVLVGLGAWASGSKESGAPAAGEKIALRAAHMQAPETPWHQTNVMFADKIREYTKGMVDITVYPAQQLGDERTIVEGVYMGTIDITMNGASFSLGGAPEISVAELPFLYKSYEHANKAIPQILIPYMNSKTIPKGVRLMDEAYAYTAYRGTLSKSKAILKFEDMKGMKVRVPQNPVYVNTFKAAGANTAVINFGEVYTALQTGVVEACELTPELIVGAKLHEVTKNFALTQHILAPLFLGINTKSWDKCAKYQTEIKKATKEAFDWYRAGVEASDKKSLQAMKDAGVAINDIGDAERQKFREAAQSAYWQEFFGKYPETKAIAEKVLALQ